MPNSLQPNGSVAMSDGGTQPPSSIMSSELSEAGLELSLASKEASKQVIKGKSRWFVSHSKYADQQYTTQNIIK